MLTPYLAGVAAWAGILVLGCTSDPQTEQALADHGRQFGFLRDFDQPSDGAISIRLFAPRHALPARVRR